MTVIFSAREIAEAAVEKERKRREFYAKVTELSKDAEVKKLFQFLKEEEDRHVAAFEKIRDNQPKDAHLEEYDEDMQAYMDSVVDDRLAGVVATNSSQSRCAVSTLISPS